MYDDLVSGYSIWTDRRQSGSRAFGHRLRTIAGAWASACKMMVNSATGGVARLGCHPERCCSSHACTRAAFAGVSGFDPA